MALDEMVLDEVSRIHYVTVTLGWHDSSDTVFLQFPCVTYHLPAWPPLLLAQRMGESGKFFKLY